MGKWKSQGQTGLDTDTNSSEVLLHQCPLSFTSSHISQQNKSCNNCPSIKQYFWHSSYVFMSFPKHGCYSRKQWLPLRVLWDAFKGNGREERGESIVRCLPRLSAHYNSSHICFSSCCFCAWWYLKESLILEGATASSEHTHAIFGFTLVIRFCCDFSKCTCLVRRYQKYLKHMIMEQFLLPEIFSWTFVINCKYLLHGWRMQ